MKPSLSELQRPVVLYSKRTMVTTPEHNRLRFWSFANCWFHWTYHHRMWPICTSLQVQPRRFSAHTGKFSRPQLQGGTSANRTIKLLRAFDFQNVMSHLVIGLGALSKRFRENVDFAFIFTHATYRLKTLRFGYKTHNRNVSLWAPSIVWAETRARWILPFQKHSSADLWNLNPLPWRCKSGTVACVRGTLVSWGGPLGPAGCRRIADTSPADPGHKSRSTGTTGTSQTKCVQHAAALHLFCDPRKQLKSAWNNRQRESCLTYFLLPDLDEEHRKVWTEIIFWNIILRNLVFLVFHFFFCKFLRNLLKLCCATRLMQVNSWRLLLLS